MAAYIRPITPHKKMSRVEIGHSGAIIIHYFGMRNNNCVQWFGQGRTTLLILHSLTLCMAFTLKHFERPQATVVVPGMMIIEETDRHL